MQRTPSSLLLVLAIMLHGCQAASNVPEIDIPSPTEIVFARTPVPSPSLSPMPTRRPIQISEAVTVTAVKGNLFIRRGPDLAYNSISVLMDGQSGKAVARDVLGGWLQIYIPDNPKETGWISIQSRYSEVHGDVTSLPVFMPTDWPSQAWLRNCTLHQMEVNPGGMIISAVYNFPDNEVQINPGVYTIHDIVVDGSPEVMELEMKEGSERDILDDGDDHHRKCPVP